MSDNNTDAANKDSQLRHEKFRMHEMLSTESSCAKLRRITFCGDSFPVASGSSGQEHTQSGGQVQSSFIAISRFCPIYGLNLIPVLEVFVNIYFSSSVAKTHATKALPTADRRLPAWREHTLPLGRPQPSLHNSSGLSRGTLTLKMLTKYAPVAVFLFVIVYYVRRGPKIHRNGENLRRPADTLPVFGNAVKFLAPRGVLFDWFVQCQRQFGLETFQIAVPTLPPGVVINDPKNLEFVMKNEASITKGEFFKRRSWDLFGYGIINADGELWKVQRKAGLKFFSGSNLDSMIEDVLPEAYVKMRAQMNSAAERGAQVDLQKLFLDLTTNVMGVMAYDMDIDASTPFSKAFDYASDQVGLRFQNPLYFITEMFTGSKFEDALSEVRTFGNQIVRNAKQRRGHQAFTSLIENEEPVFGSLIDSLMETSSNPTIVADAALNFLSAGRDTTAQSLTWTFYALMRHPGVVTRLREEHAAAFTKDQTLTATSLQPSNIPYTLAVLYESLRLYPPVPFELKQCLVPITLPDGTFLPNKSIIVWCIWAMNRSAQIWGSDAHLFRAERWLADDGKLISKTAFEFPVFNGGSRNCLGKKMAELMVCWVIVRVVREFEMKEVLVLDSRGQTTERKSQNSLTLPMEGGLPVTVALKRELQSSRT